MRRVEKFAGALLLASAFAPAAAAQAHGGASAERPPAGGRGGTFQASERLVAGGPQDFTQVRHVVLRGSNFEIGRKLAEIAATRHGVTIEPSPDRWRTRAKRNYLTRYYPGQVERMRGVAAHFGADARDDASMFFHLYYGFGTPGCSVVYYPPHTTEDGQGVLSRNFDFTTGTFEGRMPGPGEAAVCAQPYVLELYPNQGYASLSVCAFDLLGGVVDGINSEGLSIALLADDLSPDAPRPAPGPQAGFDVLEIGRYLLENCATVEQARNILLEARLYYSAIPCHYLIADRNGTSLVWENDASMHFGHVFEGDGRPQIATNALRHRRPPRAAPHREADASCERHERVHARITAHAGKFSREAILANSACIAAEAPPPPPPAAAHRTLWHALYYPQRRAMEVSFYLGDDGGGAAGGGAAGGGEADSPAPPGDDAAPKVRRSEYLRFELRTP